ncbi:MAG TPA: SDR family oxidoreductase [Gaiellaceae bacterium]|nr:SDR family oxidoreductase [Gaiellaceae bacterium]
MTLLAGRRAAVTGGARGLGAAIAALFSAEGATGAVLDLPGALGTAPAGWDAVAVDVRDEASVRDAFAGLGPLDVVVTAAGIVPGWSALAETSLDDWDEVFRVNVRGTVASIRHAVPSLRDRASVVAVGSVNSWRGDPNLASYVASKHAVLGIVRSAALDLGRRGIRVNGIAPGPIATEALLERMRRRERELGIPVEEALAANARQTALGRTATAEEVAKAALFLASDLSSGITGHLLPVDAGIP